MLWIIFLSFCAICLVNTQLLEILREEGMKMEIIKAIAATGNMGLGCKEQGHYYMFDMDIEREEFNWEVKNLLESYDIVYCFWRDESWVEDNL